MSPNGSGGDGLRGQRHEWMGFAGRHDEDGAASLVVMADHAVTPHDPPQWFVRCPGALKYRVLPSLV